MMRIEILRDGKAVVSAEGNGEAYLVFREEYIDGDVIRVTPERKGFLTLQLDAILGRATVLSDGSVYTLPVPFGQKHDCYHEYAFKGSKHWGQHPFTE